MTEDLINIIKASDSSSRHDTADSSPTADGVNASAFELILQSLREQQSKVSEPMASSAQPLWPS